MTIKQIEVHRKIENEILDLIQEKTFNEIVEQIDAIVATQTNTMVWYKIQSKLNYNVFDNIKIIYDY